MFDFHTGADDTDALIEFLDAFHQHFTGETVTLLWDGLPSHRSAPMTAWIRSQRRWLVVERLPPTPPSSTPSSTCGATSKASNSPNLCPATIDEARAAAGAGLQRAGTDYQLCFNFLDHTGSSLRPHCKPMTERCKPDVRVASSRHALSACRAFEPPLFGTLIRQTRSGARWCS